MMSVDYKQEAKVDVETIRTPSPAKERMTPNDVSPRCEFILLWSLKGPIMAHYSWNSRGTMKVVDQTMMSVDYMQEAKVDAETIRTPFPAKERTTPNEVSPRSITTYCVE
jgi:hypothetical protein